jgi:hypothetical protein
MTFLNPLVLFGLAAAAIPILIHLLNLRKLKVVEFSSLRFLKELQRTRVRRLKLRQWLILLLRTLLVVFLILAFSRPAFKGTFAGIGGGQAASTVVILLDDSPSMGLRNDHGRLFDQAKDAAAQLLSMTVPTDQVFLFRLSDLFDPSVQPLPIAPSAGLKALGGMTVSQYSSAYAPFVARGLRVLAASHNANKELHLLTDAQGTEFALTDTTAFSGLSPDPGVRVFVTEVAPSQRDNGAVNSFTLESRLLAPQNPMIFKGTITNFGESPISNTLASLYLDGTRVAQQTVSVAPHASAVVTLSAMPKRRGVIEAALHIDDDLLDIDNIRHAVVRIPERISITCVGTTAADTRFPALALTAAVDTAHTGVFAVHQITRDRLQFTDLSREDILVLSNIRTLTAAEATRIIDAVRSGRNLVVFPGKETDYNNLNSSLLAPLEIPGVTPADLSQLAPDKTGFLSFSNVDYHHPVFEGLFGEQAGKKGNQPAVESPHIRTAAGLHPGGRGVPIISLSDGRPFLCEYPAGKGKVMLFAVESGALWSDFPFKGLFAPLLHRSMVYLASEHVATDDAMVGERLRFPVRMTAEESGRAYLVRSPSGNDERVQPEHHAAAGITVFTTQPSQEVGVYSLLPAEAQPARTPPKQAIAVHLAPYESDCARVKDDALTAFWQHCGISTARIRYIDAPGQVAEIVNASRYGTEIWRLCVALALLCAFLEMVLSRASASSRSKEQNAANNI